MRIAVGVATDVGQVRTANEDAYFVDMPLFVIADGMGGHVAGDVASRTAVDAITQHRDEASAEEPQSLVQLVLEANEAVWNQAEADPNLEGMGTTCTLLYIDGPRAHIAHVGDSRAYRLRDGRLEQLTEDHTLVARMVKEGRIKPEEADRHPQRNIIMRAVGVGSDLSVDLMAIDLDEGDRLLLCSDGLSDMVDREGIRGVLAEGSEPQEAADSLVRLANEGGGEDNITAIVVDVVSETGSAAGARSGRAAGSGAPDPPARVATDHDVVPPTRGRWLRRLIFVLMMLVLLGGAGYAAARYALDRSWFVGLDGQERITIYNGIPEEIGGLELKEEMTTTTTTLDELPRFLHEGVRDGIKVSSVDEAEETVDELRARAREFARAQGAEGGGP